jgi:hypothetical protein
MLLLLRQATKCQLLFLHRHTAPLLLHQLLNMAPLHLFSMLLLLWLIMASPLPSTELRRLLFLHRFTAPRLQYIMLMFHQHSTAHPSIIDL